MALVVRVEGINQVIKALLLNKKTLTERLEKGLKKAGLYLQRKSQKIVPVQFGVLKASAFTRAEETSKGMPRVAVGYTASYAIYVHENLEAAHGKEFNIKHAEVISRKGKTKAQKKIWFRRGEDQQAKFLETPARTEKDTLLEIINDEVAK